MMKIEIWSDIVCPWCYLGKRRFESALTHFEHRDTIEVVWRSYQLDPNAPQSYPRSIDEMLSETKGISVAQAREMHTRLTAMGAQEGLDYRFDKVRYGNTFDAHRLLHLAAEHGLQAELNERFQRAYFTEGEPIGDPDTLVRLAAEVGLDADEARQAIASEEYAGKVTADLHRAQAVGVTGVPFFVIENKYAISGAQPGDLFLNALEQIWQATHHETHPAV
jgi:predicted DsbA family dithiol-disulfide isomerase